MIATSFAGKWTDSSFQEKRAESKAAMTPGVRVIVCLLFLVGRYEGWTVFAIPPLYVMFQALRERLRPATRPRVQPMGPTGAQPTASPQMDDGCTVMTATNQIVLRSLSEWR
jgi:hypothetical protein